MDAVIVSAVRTAIGKEGGSLKEIPAYVLGAAVIQAALERAAIDPQSIDDVFFGNCFAEDGNLARVAWLEAGFPVSVPAMTIDRQCGSGISAINLAAQAIRAGEGSAYVAGGAESLSQRPYLMARPKRAYDRTPPQFLRPRLSPAAVGDPPMGLTAENLAELYHIGRDEQDTYALRSQERMAQAVREGRFDTQILPLDVSGNHSGSRLFALDEHPRPTTREGLAQLRPVFKVNGTVTAGNSSGINDGAGALVVMSERRAEQLGLNILARVRAESVAGVDPNLMGLGPVPAIQKLLYKTGLTLGDIDLLEVNEAFAAQVLACDRELHWDWDRVNVDGGAIAHGHPIAATGAILATKLLNEMSRRRAKRGIVSACIGGGQGIATLFER